MPMRIVLVFLLLILCFPSTAFGQSACGAAYESSQEARAAGDLLKAREQFRICAAAECPEFVSSDCTKWLAESGDLIPSIAIKVLDESGLDLSGATVKLDGETLDSETLSESRELNPGAYQIEVTREGYEPVANELKLSQGERGRVISIKLVPIVVEGASEEAKPASGETDSSKTASPVQVSGGPSVGFYVAASSAVVGYAMFGTFAILGTSEKNRLRNDPCFDDQICDVSAVRSQYLVADIGLGVGIVSTALATVLFLTQGSAKEPEADTALRLDFAPTRGGAAAALRGRF